MISSEDHLGGHPGGGKVFPTDEHPPGCDPREGVPSEARGSRVMEEN